MFNFLKKKNKEAEPVAYTDFEEIGEDGMQLPFSPADDDTPLTPETFNSFGNNAINAVDNAMSTVGLVTTSIKESIQIVQNVKLEIAKLDHDLDRFLADSNAKLERFKSAMPVLEGQLNKISNRIDTITNTMLTNVMDTKDPNSIKKHEMMLDMLNSANDSFNNMLVKLISL